MDSRASLSGETRYVCQPGPFNRLGDEELTYILEFCVIFQNQHHLRLVNKRLAILALPLTLQTLAICSPEDLQRLIDSPSGPLLNEDLSKHVLCIEIGFPPHDFVLNSEELPKMCPNLIVVRFRFDLGVDATKLPVNIFQRVITHDSIFAEKRQRCHQSWLLFLSKFDPKKFEWVASDNRTLRLIGVHKHLRQLFSSWKNLQLVFLDGICLVEDHKMQWRVWLPANTVVIHGPFYQETLSFLYKSTRIQPAPACHLLMLESRGNAFEMRQTFAHGVPAVSLLDNTLVTTVGWTYAERELLVAGLTRYRPGNSYSRFFRSRPVSPTAAMSDLRPTISHHIPCEFFAALVIILFCLGSHVFVVPKVSFVKIDVAPAHSASRLDKFMFPHDHVSNYFRASKPDARSSQGVHRPTHPASTPSSDSLGPMGLPSCRCACDHSLPNMKNIIYS